MARHCREPGPCVTSPEAALARLAEADYDPDQLDAVAERQRQASGEPEQLRVWKLRCAACTILVGPGYHEREVWFDYAQARPICRGCALGPRMGADDVAMLVSADEVARLSVGDLSRLIKSRSRTLLKERTNGRSSRAAS